MTDAPLTPNEKVAGGHELSDADVAALERGEGDTVAESPAAETTETTETTETAEDPGEPASVAPVAPASTTGGEVTFTPTTATAGSSETAVVPPAEDQAAALGELAKLEEEAKSLGDRVDELRRKLFGGGEGL